MQTIQEEEIKFLVEAGWNPGPPDKYTIRKVTDSETGASFFYVEGRLLSNLEDELADDARDMFIDTLFEAKNDETIVELVKQWRAVIELANYYKAYYIAFLWGNLNL